MPFVAILTDTYTVYQRQFIDTLLALMRNVDDSQFGYLLVDPDGAALFNHEYLSYTLSNTIKLLSQRPVVMSKIDRTV